MLAPDLATAVGYGDKPASRHLRLISRRPLAKGALHGFCTIELLPLGLRSIDCPVLVSDGRAWCALPAKLRVENTGRQRTNAGGRPLYAAVIARRSGLEDVLPHRRMFPRSRALPHQPCSRCLTDLAASTRFETIPSTFRAQARS